MTMPSNLPDVGDLPDVTDLASSAVDALHGLASHLPFVTSRHRARRRTLWSVVAIVAVVAIAAIIRRRRSASAASASAQTSERLAAA